MHHIATSALLFTTPINILRCYRCIKERSNVLDRGRGRDIDAAMESIICFNLLLMKQTDKSLRGQKNQQIITFPVNSLTILKHNRLVLNRSYVPMPKNPKNQSLCVISVERRY